MRRLLSRFVQRLQWRLTAICVVTAVLSVTLINVFLLVIASSQLLSEQIFFRKCAIASKPPKPR